jgi:hypothetical protein
MPRFELGPGAQREPTVSICRKVIDPPLWQLSQSSHEGERSDQKGDRRDPPTGSRKPKLLTPYFWIVQRHLSLTLSRQREGTTDVPA